MYARTSVAQPPPRATRARAVVPRTSTSGMAARTLTPSAPHTTPASCTAPSSFSLIRFSCRASGLREPEIDCMHAAVGQIRSGVTGIPLRRFATVYHSNPHSAMVVPCVIDMMIVATAAIGYIMASWSSMPLSIHRPLSVPVATLSSTSAQSHEPTTSTPTASASSSQLSNSESLKTQGFSASLDTSIRDGIGSTDVDGPSSIALPSAMTSAFSMSDTSGSSSVNPTLPPTSSVEGSTTLSFASSSSSPTPTASAAPSPSKGPSVDVIAAAAASIAVVATILCLYIWRKIVRRRRPKAREAPSENNPSSSQASADSSRGSSTAPDAASGKDDSEALLPSRSTSICAVPPASPAQDAASVPPLPEKRPSPGSPRTRGPGDGAVPIAPPSTERVDDRTREIRHEEDGGIRLEGAGLGPPSPAPTECTTSPSSTLPPPYAEYR
ncbi:hypothetical protein PsYK624_128620 [Phanerochaete sordida]|uniref:Uncharacterized protein n=1 Tax=Phanerochaete sordida TaxID=48140 RepID=A0A9P3GKZ7_9APHY|nr:hypothetical protein PsYK624_128620 [Phanerochaete sordida]